MPLRSTSNDVSACGVKPGSPTSITEIAMRKSTTYKKTVWGMPKAFLTIADKLGEGKDWVVDQCAPTTREIEITEVEKVD